MDDIVFDAVIIIVSKCIGDIEPAKKNNGNKELFAKPWGELEEYAALSFNKLS